MTLSLYSASKSTAAVVVLLGSLLGACCVECQPLAVGYQRVVKLAEESVVSVRFYICRLWFAADDPNQH